MATVYCDNITCSHNNSGNECGKEHIYLNTIAECMNCSNLELISKIRMNKENKLRIQERQA